MKSSLLRSKAKPITVPQADVGEALDFPALRKTPTVACDLVMKGGVTSGVVYPRAIIGLASKYRLTCIGGSSAGAIAAALAAAAESNRESGGYEQLEVVAEKLPDQLASLFQPTSALRPVFTSALALLGKKGPTFFGTLAIQLAHLTLIHIRLWSLLGALVLGLTGCLVADGTVRLVLAGGGQVPSKAVLEGAHLAGSVLGALIGVIAGALVTLCSRTKRGLEDADFGFCPGVTMTGDRVGKPGLSEWLHQRINTVAGLGVDSPPLTFRQLRDKGVHLAVTTTNLSELRPYRLPFVDNNYYFRKEDLDKVFPTIVCETLFPDAGKSAPASSGAVFRDGDYARFVEPIDMPVVMAVRLSLSFPLLLSTVSLYAKECEGGGFKRHTFSDGGITSNIPTHFFDAPLPRRPTFAINLETFDEERHTTAVSLPTAARPLPSRRVGNIRTVAQFASAIVDTLQEWNDNSRLEQPGSRERVAAVRLAPGEGGLNLVMAPAQVRTLMDRGQAASWLLRRDFDFDVHRWRRYLVWSNALEDALYRELVAYTKADEVETRQPFAEFLSEVSSSHPAVQGFGPKSEAWLADVNRRTRELMDLLTRQGVPGEPGSQAYFNEPDAPQPRPEPEIALVAKS